MALIKFGNHLDASGYEIRNRKIEKVASLPAPVAGDEGREVFLTSTKRYYVSTGSAWELKATDSDLLGGQNSAWHRDLSNSTGNLTSGRISDFDTQVRNSRLDQLALPTAAVSLNSQKLTNVANGTAANDAVNKSQLDAVSAIANAAASGVAIKSPVRAVATGNIATLSGTQTIDGVALVANDRVLLAGQTTASANGIYVVASGAWTRATDADGTNELAPGTLVAVREGTSNGDSLWGITSDAAITVGTTAQTWVKLLSAGGTSFSVAGSGLTSSGSTISVQAGLGIIADGSSTRVDTTVVARKYVGDVPAGTSPVTITHNLNTTDVMVTVKEVSSGDIVLVGTTISGVNTVSLDFGANPVANQYRVIIVG